MYELLKQEQEAKRGRFTTVHGVIETPVFMNVATAGAIKGGLSSEDLNSIDTQVALCNTYHLHVRPGDALIHELGGLHHFMQWNKPILTDSGGFQVFSLAELRKIKEEGVSFRNLRLSSTKALAEVGAYQFSTITGFAIFFSGGSVKFDAINTKIDSVESGKEYKGLSIKPSDEPGFFTKDSISVASLTIWYSC